MPKNRPDKHEFEKRLFTIQGWMIDGVPSALIVKNIMHQSWVKSERHAFILLQKARERWIQFEDDNILDKRKLKVQELKNRIRGMANEFKSTPSGMRAILMYEKEIIKLEGLYYDPDKVAPNIINVELSSAEIKKYDKELESEF